MKKITRSIMTQTTQTIHLNKDVLSIIGEYSRPNLWLYWIVDNNMYHDNFDNSIVVESTSDEHARIKIFNTHVRHFFKESYLRLNTNMIRNLKIMDTGHMDINCVPCGRFYLGGGDSPCYEHYPPTDILLSYLESIGFGKPNMLMSIEVLIKKGIIKLKKLDW